MKILQNYVLNFVKPNIRISSNYSSSGVNRSRDVLKYGVPLVQRERLPLRLAPPDNQEY